MTRSPRTAHPSPLVFRSARPTDGASLWRLVQATGTLEANSPYFYLLFATDFGRTCLVAEQDGEPVGAVIGYHPPEQADTAFVWQIGLLPSHRGQGLGSALLLQWLALPANRGTRWVTATVADDNPTSQALFKRLAERLGTGCVVEPHFTPDQFPVEHPSEPLFRIGPLPGSQAPSGAQRGTHPAPTVPA